MTVTQKSATAPEDEIASILESEELTAEESQETSLSEMAAALGIKDFPKEETKPSKAKPKSEESPQEPEDSEKPAEAGSLGDILKVNKKEPLTFKKENSKYPDVQDGDIVKNDKGTPIIKAKHIYDDIVSIFGVYGKAEPKLETFFLINKHKPEKADIIAKTSGFKSRHHLAAAIEEFKEAADNNDEKRMQEIIDSQFPEWTRYGSDVEPPFLTDLDSSIKAEDPEVKKGGAGKFPYSPTELEQAIDNYVADNGNVTKKDILASVKLRESLVEFSAFQKNGKRISANEALKLAIQATGVKRTPLSKSDKASVGGGGNQPQLQPSTTPKIQSSLRQALGMAGINPKEFEAFEKKKGNS